MSSRCKCKMVMDDNIQQIEKVSPNSSCCMANGENKYQIINGVSRAENTEFDPVKRFSRDCLRGRRESNNLWPTEVPQFDWDYKWPNQLPRLDWGLLDDGQLFFDREKELQQLKEAFLRRIQPDSKPEIILISGRSGTGKTLLAKRLHETVREKNGFFVTGKFDQLQQREPYAPLVTAMTEFVYLSLKRGKEAVQKMKDEILNLVGNDIGVLTMMIPALNELVGQQHPRILRGPDAQDRLKIIFQKFIRACAKRDPLVILMDDIQWADRGSLEIFEAIASDDLNHSLAVVCVCRSDEVSINHDFACLLRRLEDENQAKISNIEVGCLTLDATRLLLSSLLQSSDILCEHLASTLFSKTQGNVFFIFQFLYALYASRILRLEEHYGRWTWKWNEAAYRFTFGHVTNIIDLLAARIRKLTFECHIVLKTSACLGIELDIFLLSKVIDESLDVDEILRVCVEESLMIYDEKSSCYRFSHDQIQQASYMLIPESNRPLFHYTIGCLLCETLSESELDQYIFVAVDQIIRGVAYVEDEQELVGLSWLCMHAGERAMSSSDFKTAVKYFDLSSSLLDSRRRWVDCYNLSLSLANARAESLCCNSDFDAVDEVVKSTLEYARCFDDKILAYTCQIYAFGARLRLKEAILLGLEVLDRLGESFPEKGSNAILMTNLFHIKFMLSRKTNKDILGLPDISSQTKLSAMSILNVLITHSYLGRPDLFPFFALRMVKLSIKYGLSAISSMGFCCYGLLLSAIGDFDGGNRFGELSLCLLERYDSVMREWKPRVYMAYYGMIAHWKFPVKSTLEPLLEARQIGMLIGDYEYASASSFQYFCNASTAGIPLLTLEPPLRNALVEMKDRKQQAWLELLSLLREYIFILKGKADDSVVVDGALMNQDEPTSPKMVEIMRTANLNFQFYSCMASYYRMMTSFFLGDTNVALEMARKSEKCDKIMPSAPVIRLQAFFDGLVAFDAVRQSQLMHSLQLTARKRLILRGKKKIRKLKKISKHCPQNNEHILLLLEAELAALKGKLEEATSKYSLSEEICRKEGYVDIQAIACERAGLTIKWSGKDEERSRILLKRAIQLYRSWGAFAKVDQLLTLLED